MKLLNPYLDGVGLAARDPMVRRRLIEVAQLIRPLSDLYQPAVVGRVGAAFVANVARALCRIVTRPEPAKISPMPPMMAHEPMRGEPAAA